MINLFVLAETNLTRTVSGCDLSIHMGTAVFHLYSY